MCREKERFDDFSSFDYIFMEQQWPELIFYPFYNKNLRNALISNKEKIISIFTDVADLEIRKKGIETDYYINKFSQKRFNTYFDSDEEITRWADFLRFLQLNRPIIIPTFYSHSEIKDENIYNLNFVNWFDKQSNIPFEKKDDKVCSCIGSYFRGIKKTVLKKFGLTLDDIEIIGMTFKDYLHKKEERSNFLSENDVQKEYAKHKFIFSQTYKIPGRFTWFRTRFLYSAMNKCVILGTDPEIQYYGEPFQLDASVFTKSLKEQKEVAEAQSEYFFGHCMTNEESEANLIEALNK